MAEKLNDRWHRLDEPVLLEAARQCEAGEEPDLNAMADKVGIDHDAVDKVLSGLEKAGYLELVRGTASMAGPGTIWEIEILERGRRSTGLWPNEDEAADALIELLDQAAGQVEDEDDAGALRKAGRLLKSVPSSVISDLTMALIRSQTGLP